MNFIFTLMNIKNYIKYKQIQKLVLGLAFFSFFIITAQNEVDEPLQEKETVFKGVYDYANLLSPQEENQLSQKLIQYSDTTSTQITVAIIQSLNGHDISMLATEKAHDWGIGQKRKDNGVFIVIAQKEREINISTGYGVEHLLTDFKSKQIIDKIITPNFKNQQYYRGLDNATNAIIQILAGTYKADAKTESSEGFPFVFVILIIIILFIIFSKKNNSGKGNKGNRRLQRDSSDILTSILLSSMGRGAGRSSGGFGGGSFGGGGFGGGGFGGGGASGGW